MVGTAGMLGTGTEWNWVSSSVLKPAQLPCSTMQLLFLRFWACSQALWIDHHPAETLASSMATAAPPSPLVVVGCGRVGNALLRMGAGHVPQVTIRGQGQHLGDALAAAGAADAAGPILVATTNDALPKASSRCWLPCKPCTFIVLSC